MKRADVYTCVEITNVTAASRLIQAESGGIQIVQLALPSVMFFPSKTVDNTS